MTPETDRPPFRPPATEPDAPIRIVFVCWGNICRSPTGAGIMQDLAARRGLAHRVVVDSAGVSAEHLGQRPDRRAIQEAADRGLLLEHRAWQFTAEDFDRFDVVLAADQQVMARLQRLVRSSGDAARLAMIRRFDADRPDAEVPDPYYGGPDGFREVFEILTAASNAWLDQLLPS